MGSTLLNFRGLSYDYRKTLEEIVMGILQWASHFKNVRCLLLFNPEAPPGEEMLSWVIKKHRYRQIGVVSSLVTSEQRLSRSPFVTLYSPDAVLDGLIEVLEHKLPIWLAQSLILSFCYAAPLLCLDEELTSLLLPFSPWSLRPKGQVNEAEIIRHLRIAGYIPIDFFPLVEKAYQILREGDEGNIEELIRERRQKAIADGRNGFGA